MNRQQRRRIAAQAKKGALRSDGEVKCLTCGTQYSSRAAYLRHVTHDHGIPEGDRIFDFDGMLYNVSAIERLARDAEPQFGPFILPLDEKMMWSISQCAVSEVRISQLTDTDLGWPILAVRHESLDYVRCIDGHHRIHKLHRLGRSSLRAYVVSEADVAVHIQSGLPRPSVNK
jgi:uncharacterized C2H2 Zn-finger protein